MADVIDFPTTMPGSVNCDPNGEVLSLGECQDVPSPEFSKLDLDALFNIREWVRSALEAKGARIVGSGIGVGGAMGVADVQIELEGHQYNIGITPL